MRNNPHFNMELHSLWCSKQEFKELIDSLNHGENDKILDIIYLIHKRGDIN